MTTGDRRPVRSTGPARPSADPSAQSGSASASTGASPNEPSLARLLAERELVVCCGAGGVGKTTTAAAIGVAAALHTPRSVLVVTVDPARRLADALGLDAIGNLERVVPPEAFAGAGQTPVGQLSVAMLDTKQSWDALIARHAPDARTRDAILANPLYTNITAKFVQSHDYIAMERLYELHASARYDLVVVDTPPSRNALDFLDAPARMAEFFGSRLLRWLTVPYRSRLLNAASKPFYQVADRILGSKFLQDIAEFFLLFQTMEKGFVRRADEVRALLGGPATTFCVVSTLEPTPVREAEFLMAELGRRRLHLGALVLNKVLPASLLEPEAAAAAVRLGERADALATRVAPLVRAQPADVARVLREVSASHARFRVAAEREAESRASLASAPQVVVTVPQLDGDITDLAGLAGLASRIW